MIARILITVCLLAATARADDKVALLPLDAPAKLEVYGQVVASEIAQALIAGKIDVVVVLPKMAVPDEAKLIVDGKISAGKGTAIDLSIRVREPKVIKPVVELKRTAASLETLDKTTRELADEVLPALRDKLAAITKASEPVIKPVITPVRPVEPQREALRPILVGVMSKSSSANADKLRIALVETMPSWVARAQRVSSTIEAGMLDAKTATKTVAGSNTDRAIAFEVLGYSLWGDTVPMGRARVRVRIADAGQILFERVVVTDTIVGDKGMSTDAFALRVANDVLAILRPHVRRTVPGWP